MNDPASDAPRILRRPPLPAVPAAIAFALGIGGDRWLGLDAHWWLAGGVVLLAAWGACLRWNSRLAAVLLLLACAAAGGARHHGFRGLSGPNDVARLVAVEERPIRVQGRVASRPLHVHRPQRAAWQESESTVCTLECRSFVDRETLRPLTGAVRLQITGECRKMRVGDLIEVQGGISAPGAAANPGGFDFREYLTNSGQRAVVRCEHPEGLRVIQPRGRFAGWRAAAQERCETVIRSSLGERTAPVGIALLLGVRSGIDGDVRDAFVRSGMMHVLAISGMHVAILAGFLFLVCRAANFSVRTTALMVVSVILAYAFLAESRPPVIRATVLVLLTAAALPAYRPVSSTNLLAVAALVVMAWRPVDLFDTGAQLSFLAVAAILWVSPWMRRVQSRAEVWQIDGVPIEAGLPRRVVWRVWVAVVAGVGMSAVITLVTAPLVAARFHLVSPIGLGVNVLLMPFIGVTLISGFLMMWLGLAGVPLLTPLAGWVFDRSLGLLLAIVDGASHIHLGHAYVAGPKTGWLVVFYALVAVAMTVPRSARQRRWCCGLVGVWLCVGLSTGLQPPRPGGLRCTFASVGHGCAILLETPSGRTLVYDTGSIADGKRAALALQGVLWHHGHNHLDVLVVSHADADHYNGVPELLESVPVRTACIARSFLDFRQAGVVRVCEAARAKRVPLRFVSLGDQLRLDPDVAIEVAHPGLFDNHETDNANSIVLAIHYAGRSLWLTGDLEHGGLQTVMSRPTDPIDVLLSPHHGSRISNIPELAAWARPRTVVSSQGRRTRTPLAEIYGPDSRVLQTSETGAVTVEIAPTGELTVSTQLGDP